MLQEVDESIRRLLIGEMKSLTAASIKDESQILLGLAPSDPPKDGKPRIYLFLHDLRENLALRDESFHTKRSPGDWMTAKRPATMRLDLSYIVTVSAPDLTMAHQVLGEALACLVRNTVVPEKYLGPSLRDESPGALFLAVAQPDHPA